MTVPHATQPTPRPPTDAERAAAARWRAAQTTRQRGEAFVVLVIVAGVLLLGGAFVAYTNANQSVRDDNPFMSGDQAHAANFGPAIFLAVAGAFVLLLAAIIGSARRR